MDFSVCVVCMLSDMDCVYVVCSVYCMCSAWYGLCEVLVIWYMCMWYIRHMCGTCVSGMYVCGIYDSNQK